MPRLYGMVIRRKLVAGQPPEEKEFPIDRATKSIGNAAGCDIPLDDPDLSAVEMTYAMLICDLGDARGRGGISLVNTSPWPIAMFQAAAVEAVRRDGEPVASRSGQNNRRRPGAPRQEQLASGQTWAIDNGTIARIGSYELEFRLAPFVPDRRKIEADLVATPFRIELAPQLTPVDPLVGAAAAGEAEAISQGRILKPGDEAVLLVQVSNTINNVQDITFRAITEEQVAAPASSQATALSLRYLPAPGWISFARPRINLQTSDVGRPVSQAIIVLKPPRSPLSRAGQHTFQIAADSNRSGRAMEPQLLQITLLPYVELKTTMRRAKVTARRRGDFALEIQNNSNWPVPLLIELRNREDALEYELFAVDRDRWNASRTDAERQEARIAVHQL